MTPSERLALFASTYQARELPEKGLERVKAGIMDYVGVMLAGRDEECAVLVRRMVSAMGGAAQASIWGTGQKTSLCLAALANGTAAHALDFDDVSLLMFAHPSLQLLPGLFALGEYQHRSGLDLITAYVAGFEVGAKLGRAMNPNHVTQGWFPVGTMGPLMQAAACARLLNLTPRQTQMALGLAANMASGLRANNGTMAKPLLAGHGAASGILAAALAKEGMTANPDVLEDRFGYIENFSGGSRAELAHALESLGNPLDIAESGVSFKLYPCCAGAHSAIDCALKIAQRHAPIIEEIEAIEMLVPARLRFVLIHPRPWTVDEARFSLEYCVSRALIDRQMGVAQFTPQKIADSAVRVLMEKVQPQYHEFATAKGDLGYDRLPVEINLHLSGGLVHSARVEHAKGTPQNPLSWSELEEKFRQCCSRMLSDAKIRDIVKQFSDFEQLADIVSLTSRFDEVSLSSTF